LAACYLLDSRRDFNGGGDVLMKCDGCQIDKTKYCCMCRAGKLVTGGFIKNDGSQIAYIKDPTEIILTQEQLDKMNEAFLRQIPDKALFAEYNRRLWREHESARQEYEAKGKPVMD
jgi:hypothetical protein